MKLQTYKETKNHEPLKHSLAILLRFFVVFEKLRIGAVIVLGPTE
jgi:hypothetical protein